MKGSDEKQEWSEKKRPKIMELKTEVCRNGNFACGQESVRIFMADSGEEEKTKINDLNGHVYEMADKKVFAVIFGLYGKSMEKQRKKENNDDSVNASFAQGSEVVCRNWHKEGHVKKECPKIR